MSETENHFQKLFSTGDDIHTIVGVIEYLSGYKADEVILWTPNPHVRNTGDFDRLCGLQKFFNRFVIIENAQVNQKGRARGLIQ
jgi:hypothetical protein